MTQLQAALDWAAKGFPIFPCYSRDKSPFTKNGHLDATTDPEIIKAWWDKFPHALIGMPTGKASGIAVLDLDRKKGKDGFLHVPDWESRSNVIARTMTGGAHLYFKAEGAPHCTSDKIAKGVDTRGDGGYVIVPPSPGYQWVNGSDLSNLPTWPDDLRPPMRDPNASANDELEAENPDEAVCALAVIPNPDLGWDEWIRIGMATHAATGGSDQGEEAFGEWSAKSTKYNARTTQKVWKGFDRNPPERIGAGTLYYEARAVDPHWLDKVHDWLGERLQNADPHWLDEHDRLGERLQNGCTLNFAEYYQEISDPPDADKTDGGSTEADDGSAEANDGSTEQSEAPKKKQSTTQNELVMVCVADVPAEPIDWLWKPRIARKKLTMIAGMPDVNKSTMTVDLAAKVSTGALLPAGEGHAPIGRVIILTAEDDIADTIRPRLEVAGADLSKIIIITAARERNKERSFDLTSDIDRMKRAIEGLGDVALVIIDPVSAYMGRPSKLDSYRSTDVRGVLAPLVQMAASTRVAVVGIDHLSKSGSPSALLRLLGSIAFSAAPRSVYIIARDEEDANRRLFLPAKNNLAKIRTGLAFRVKDKFGTGAIGFDSYPVIEWEAEPVSMTADEALAQRPDGRRSEKAEAAKALILKMLKDKPQLQKDIEAATLAQEISPQNLKTAKKGLGVSSHRTGAGKDIKWWWVLPGQQPPL